MKPDRKYFNFLSGFIVQKRFCAIIWVRFD